MLSNTTRNANITGLLIVDTSNSSWHLVLASSYESYLLCTDGSPTDAPSGHEPTTKPYEDRLKIYLVVSLDCRTSEVDATFDGSRSPLFFPTTLTPQNPINLDSEPRRRAGSSCSSKCVVLPRLAGRRYIWLHTNCNFVEQIVLVWSLLIRCIRYRLARSKSSREAFPCWNGREAATCFILTKHQVRWTSPLWTLQPAVVEKQINKGATVVVSYSHRWHILGSEVVG